MRKFTLLTAVFALFATAASADTKVIYQDNYSDEQTSLANWTTNRAGYIKYKATSDGNYIQFNYAGSTANGTRNNSYWGATPWEGITIPATGYVMKFSFNFEQFGNDAAKKGSDGNYQQRNHELAIVSATDCGISLNSYYGTAADVIPNYLFKITQCQTGDVPGEGGYPTAVNGTCGFYINNETDLVTVAAATWYNLTLEVVGQTVKYDISDISGTPLKAGSYTLAEGADNRAGGILQYQARSQGIFDIGLSLQITMESDEPVANEPTVTLNQVKGNDRVYKATFAEGEMLHYILPGGEEQTIDYWDAEGEDGNPGSAMLTATQSGTLQAWTTKDVAVSKKVNVEVTAGWIKLVDPVVAISNVSEGFGKSFTVTFNSTAPEHLLPVKAAITYTIDGGAEQEVANGGTITMDKAGKLVVTVNQIPQGGQEYYQRSSVTINNDVEYQIALDVQYINWDDSHFAGNANWTAGKLEDSNMSHWAGHWQEANKYDKEEQDKMKEDPNYVPVPTQNPVKVYRTDGSYDLPIYTLTNDEAGVNYANELLPLIPNTARANIAILLEEGLFANTTSYNNLEITFDSKWVTDDAAKPNFIEIRRTNNYDRYDKGPGRHITDIVKTDKADYTITRFDTAIHSARVFTYKGFVPGSTGIEAITTVKEADKNAPIYTIGGVQVKDASQKGIYIQNGKKFVVK